MPRRSDFAHDQNLDRLVRDIPTCLYRYMNLAGERLEWARKLIVDSTLFFAPPSFFNDPLDCRIPPSFDGSAFELESYWRRSAQESGHRARDYKQ